MDSPPTFSLLVFPFLATSEPVTIGKYRFRPTTDIAGLAAPQAKAVADIRDMLFFQGDYRVDVASYAEIEPVDLRWRAPELPQFEELQAVVAYRYSAPHETLGEPLLESESATLLLFSPGLVSATLVHPVHRAVRVVGAQPPPADPFGQIPGYQGLYNLREMFWVAAGSRIYGSLPHIGINLSQNLASEFGSHPSRWGDSQQLQSLLRAAPSAGRTRVTTALRWFARANAGLSDDANALLCLAIAFEALLGLPEREKLTARFVDSIALLLGRVPRLDDWATQFYKARSQVVHEGRVKALRFRVREQPGREYLPLLSYGRHVFRMCVTTLLTGMDVAERRHLAEYLVTNEERLTQICMIANDAEQPNAQRIEQIRPLVKALVRYSLAPEDLGVAPAVGAVCAVARLVLDSGEPMDDRARVACDAIVKAKRTPDHFDQLEAIGGLAHVLPDWLWRDGPAAIDVLRQLAGMVWHRAWMYFEQLKDSPQHASPPPPSTAAPPRPIS